MDVMQPSLVCVDGGNYRFCESNFWQNDDIETTLNFDDSDIEKFDDLESAFGSIDEFFETPDVEAANEPEFSDFEEETLPSEIVIPPSEIEISPSEIDVVPIEKGRFKYSFNLNPRYFPIIVGYRQAVQKSIELETDTSLRLPFRGEGNEVVIIGCNAEGVIAAKHKIDAIVKGTGFNLSNAASSNIFNRHEDDTKEFDDFDEKTHADIKIVSTKNGSFKYAFSLDRKYCSFILGPKQITKYEIETTTGVRLYVPKFNEPPEVVIVGRTKKSVILAKLRVDAKMQEFDNRDRKTFHSDNKMVSAGKDEYKHTFCTDRAPNSTLHPDIKIVSAGKDEYKHTFCTDRRYFSYMIGPGGSVSKEIHSKTGTHVSVPKLNEGKEVVLTGRSKDGIIMARLKIDAIIKKYRDRFDSVPKINVETPKSQELDDFGGKSSTTDIEIVSNEKTGYKHTFHGERKFFSLLVGPKGINKHYIETETDTSIDIPRSGQGNEIVIKGHTREGIVSARRKIDEMIKKPKIHYDYTARTNDKFPNTQEFHDVDKKTLDPDIKIVPGENGGYKHIFSMQWRYYPFIVGERGYTKNVIEAETNTLVDVPKADSNDHVVISGPNKQGIVSARRKIDAIIKTQRIKMDYQINNFDFTHFISIPIKDSIIASNYMTFKNFVLNETGKNSQGVCEEIFQKAEKLHLVVGMLVLPHTRDVKVAIEALNGCKEIIIKPLIEKMGSIKLKAQGLSCMIHADDETDTLRCNITTENNVLQELASEIADFFTDTGLMTEKTSKLMDLNIKLMSSKFDKKEPPKYFYVKDILREHKGRYFGEMELSSIHISTRGKYDDTGYYASVAKIDIP